METYDVVEMWREDVRLHSEALETAPCPELEGALVSEASEDGFLVTMKNGQRFKFTVEEVK